MVIGYKRILNSNLEVRIPLEHLIFNLLSINYEPPRYPWHTNNHCHSSYELHFVPEGYGTVIVDAIEYTIEPGTFYLTGPGIYHEQFSRPDDPMTEYCMNFDFFALKPQEKELGEARQVETVLSRTPFYFGRDTFDGHSLCRRMIEEINAHCLGFVGLLRCLSLEVILETARAISPDKQASYALPEKDLNTKRRLLADEFFRDYAQNRRAFELADILGVSVRHLNRILLHYYGLTFHQKLIRTRLDQAKALLAATNRPVAEVGEAVGYPSAAGFSQIFRQYEGCTPSDYRQGAHSSLSE